MPWVACAVVEATTATWPRSFSAGEPSRKNWNTPPVGAGWPAISTGAVLPSLLAKMPSRPAPVVRPTNATVSWPLIAGFAKSVKAPPEGAGCPTATSVPIFPARARYRPSGAAPPAVRPRNTTVPRSLRMMSLNARNTPPVGAGCPALASVTSRPRDSMYTAALAWGLVVRAPNARSPRLLSDGSDSCLSRPPPGAGSPVRTSARMPCAAGRTPAATPGPGPAARIVRSATRAEASGRMRRDRSIRSYRSPASPGCQAREVPQNYRHRRANCCLKMPVTGTQEATWVLSVYGNTPHPFVLAIAWPHAVTKANFWTSSAGSPIGIARSRSGCCGTRQNARAAGSAARASISTPCGPPWSRCGKPATICAPSAWRPFSRNCSRPWSGTRRSPSRRMCAGPSCGSAQLPSIGSWARCVGSTGAAASQQPAPVSPPCGPRSRCAPSGNGPISRPAICRPICWDSSHDFFLTSLLAIDVATGWTELQAVWGKGHERVGGAMQAVRQALPMPLLGLHTDNGSEFLNHILVPWCRDKRIAFTRGRPYRKNDQAYVEQRNGAVLRRYIGYDRYSTRAAFTALQAIHELLRLYVNFFQPVRKLVSKERHGARVIKRYDRAQTPYRRLLTSGVLTPERSAALTAQYQALNPLRLRAELQTRLDALWKLADGRRAGS